MRVSHLSLSDFRNYSSVELSLRPGPNLLIGRNGQGKTNLVEAIGYFSNLRSHRVSSDAALIRSGQDRAIAQMRVEAAGRSVILEIEVNLDRQNRASVNRAPSRPRELMRWFASVAFVPEDLGIVRGDPSGRRRFLDDALMIRHPIAAGTLSDYDRVLRQRTALLKSARGAGSAAASTLAVWDDQLVATGSQIMLARRELVRDLESPLRAGYASLVAQDHAPALGLQESVYAHEGVSRETIAVSHRSDVSRETIADDFHAALQSVRDRELERGVTLVGPHRDDLILELNGMPVKGFASHGETWSFVLSLKLALATLLREESPAGDPVIILDDVFAELDQGRRDRLLRALSDFEQVIVTAAVEEDVPAAVGWHRTRIEGGAIVESDEGRAQ